MPSAPSFITKRNDVYYFQLKVPSAVESSPRLIRRSLRTKCRRQALALARKWWLQLFENDFQWEDEAKEQDRRLSRGKALYERLQDHERQTQYHNGETDPLAIEDFMASLNAKEAEDLQAYSNYINQQRPNSSDSSRDSDGHGREVPKQRSDAVTETLLTAIQETRQQSALAARGIEEHGKPLSELVDTYIRDKARKSNPVKTAMDKGLFDMETELQRLIMFVGDLPNQELTKRVLKDRYIDRRSGLPNMLHRNVKYMDGKQPKIDRLTGQVALDQKGKPKEAPIYKPMDEILEIARSSAGTRLQTARTINNEFTTIATFLRAMERNGLIENGLADYLISCKLEVDGDSTVVPFSKEDLKLLFNNETYRKGLLFDKPHRHWLPLISLYHGNRIGEMAMLYVDDLRPVTVEANGQTQTIWVFVIQRNEERKQVRKNKQSARIVPVHQTLIDLGLIEYRQQLIDSGVQQLFPAEKPSSGNNWGNNTSAWFNNSHDGNTTHGKGYVEWCGVQKEVTIDGVTKRKVFHSLRKTWSTQAKRQNMDPDMRREITGHGEGRSLDVHAKTYEDSYELWDQKQALDQIHFDLDLSLIRVWGKNDPDS